MGTLLVLVWGLYFAETAARWRPGGWAFRGTRAAALRRVERPDLELLDGGVGVVVLPAFPWQHAWRAGGTDWDLASTRKRMSEVARAVRPLRFAASGLFASLLVGGTVLVLSERFVPALVPWSIVSGASWATTLWFFFRAYRRVHGRWPPLEASLSAILSPLSLIHSPHAVRWSAIERAHPLTATAAVCDDQTFLNAARRWHFDRPEDRREVSRLAAQLHLLGALRAPPVELPDGLTRFCPRCHQGYESGATVCADCGGVRLSELLHEHVGPGA